MDGRHAISGDAARRLGPVALCLLTAWMAGAIGCGESEPETQRFLTPEATNDLVLRLAGTGLPPEAIGIHGLDTTGVSRTIHVRFACTPEQLAAFLAASPVLPDTLLPDYRPLKEAKTHIPFWRPDRLTGVRGLQAAWKRDLDQVSVLLVTGTDDDASRPVTYLLFVLDPMASRGSSSGA